jgi:hypothetical protein
MFPITFKVLTQDGVKTVTLNNGEKFQCVYTVRGDGLEDESGFVRDEYTYRYSEANQMLIRHCEYSGKDCDGKSRGSMTQVCPISDLEADTSNGVDKLPLFRKPEGGKAAEKRYAYLATMAAI